MTAPGLSSLIERVEKDHFCGWPEGSEECRMWHHAGVAVPIYRPGDKRPDAQQKPTQDQEG